MQIYHIAVTFEGGVLTVDPAPVAIQALRTGDQPMPACLWTFEGIEDMVAGGWSPAIQFVGSETGPFANLSRWPFQAGGSGNLGSPGTYTYQAVLAPPAGSELSVIASASASLDNQVELEAPDTSPVVEVKIVDEDEPYLLVTPNDIGRLLDQTIVWRVIGEAPPQLGDAYYARVAFVDGPADSDLTFGPFTSWENYGTALLGSGQAGRAGVFNYYFELVSVTNDGFSIKSSPDPTVDDRGEPPIGNVYQPRPLRR